MNYTKNYNIKKPLTTEKYDVNIVNANSDLIDATLKKLESKDLEQDNLLASKEALNAHAANQANPHKVTKSQVGLGNVSNNRQVKGLADGTTQDHIVAFGPDGYTIKDSGFTAQAATTDQPGLVQLENSVTSESTTRAATANAARLAYEKAADTTNLINTEILRAKAAEAAMQEKLDGIEAGAVQGNWDINDQASPSFIKNRTHYVSKSVSLAIPKLMREDTAYQVVTPGQLCSTDWNEISDESQNEFLTKLADAGIDYVNTDYQFHEIPKAQMIVDIDGKKFILGAGAGYRIQRGDPYPSILLTRADGMPVFGATVQLNNGHAVAIRYDVYVYFAIGNCKQYGIGLDFNNGFDAETNTWQASSYSFAFLLEDVVTIPDKFIDKTDLWTKDEFNIENAYIGGSPVYVKRFTGTGPDDERRNRLCVPIYMADGDSLGLCKPISKSADMTQQVGIDTNGRLWTASAADGTPLINNLTTAQSGAGALDAAQGKTLKDRIEEVFQYCSDKKASVAAAVTAKGQAATEDDTWDVLLDKIAAIQSVLTGTAKANHVLAGKTFYSTDAGTPETGTMPNKGSLNWSASNTTYTVPAGYYSGGTLDSRPSYTAGYAAAPKGQKVIYCGSMGIQTDSVQTDYSLTVTSKLSNYKNLTINNFLFNQVGNMVFTGGDADSSTSTVTKTYNAASGVITITVKDSNNKHGSFTLNVYAYYNN